MRWAFWLSLCTGINTNSGMADPDPSQRKIVGLDPGDALSILLPGWKYSQPVFYGLNRLPVKGAYE
jgi:hypothetical protein